MQVFNLTCGEFVLTFANTEKYHQNCVACSLFSDFFLRIILNPFDVEMFKERDMRRKKKKLRPVINCRETKLNKASKAAVKIRLFRPEMNWF